MFLHVCDHCTRKYNLVSDFAPLSIRILEFLIHPSLLHCKIREQMLQVDSGGPVKKTRYILFEMGNCFHYFYMSRTSHWILCFTIRVATVEKEYAFLFSHRLLIGRQDSHAKLFFLWMLRNERYSSCIIETLINGVMISVIGIKMYK